jgi:restriction system protein
MSRRGLIGVLVSELNRQTKAQARARAEAERAARRNLHEAQRAADRQLRETARTAKEAKKAYEESRAAEAASLNAEVKERKETLQSVLPDGLQATRPLFVLLREEFPKLEIPKALTVAAPSPTRNQYHVPDISFLEKLIPGATAKHEAAAIGAENAFKEALRRHQQGEFQRKAEIDRLKLDHQTKIDALKLEVDALENSYRAGRPSAIVEYYSLILQRATFPDDFPQGYRVAYVPESKQLVVECQLPSPEVVPTVAEYKYVKSKDTIEEKDEKPNNRRELYQDVVAAVGLRTLHCLFANDKGEFVDVITLNGFVQAIDPATGKDIRPHLISVRATKERLAEIDLRKVDLVSCVRNLGAQLTQSPTELVPVKPIIEFDMADRRFVSQTDVLSELESRPNIMDLSPFEFETLVSNLFGKMGLESKLTRSSRDGGVDVVSFDKRPVLGGKVVIQAKRYRHTVGVSAVRDLFGTMMNEGANKGILVTTSGYGPDAYEFSQDKPIELIDGGGLLYLLEQVGVKARIDMPPEQ